MRWLTPPPHRTAYFSRRRIPGVVLRVSRIAAPVPAIASTHVRVSVAMPLRWPSRLRAGRSARSRSCVRPVTLRIVVPSATDVPSGTSGAHDRVVPAHVREHGRGDGDAGHHAGLPRHQVQRRALPGGHGRHRRHVDAAVEILVDGPADERLQVVRVEPGRDQLAADLVAHPRLRARAVAHLDSPVTGSSCVVHRPSSSSRVTSRTRQRASSRSGWSSRQCDPRVSVRRSA